jgi:hypothetical protein
MARSKTSQILRPAHRNALAAHRRGCPARGHGRLRQGARADAPGAQGEFETATRQAGHDWHEVDVTTRSPRGWPPTTTARSTSSRPRTCSSSCRPSSPSTSPTASAPSSRARRHRDSVVAVFGVGSLFGFAGSRTGAEDRRARRQGPPRRVLSRASRAEQLPAARCSRRLELHGRADLNPQRRRCSMKIKDVLQRDPFHPSPGQPGAGAHRRQVERKALEELRGELSTFVCEGQYADGMQKILRSYLANSHGKTSQKAAWVSGFFGSGKSHLLKMLCHLWQDTEVPRRRDGSQPRPVDAGRVARASCASSTPRASAPAACSRRPGSAQRNHRPGR